MTCIVGLVHNGSVILAGDSAGTEVGSGSCDLRATSKVFRNGEFVMGYTSSFRMGQLLEHVLKLPKQKVNQSDMAFLVDDFIEAVRTLFEERGFLTTTNEEGVTGEHRGGIFLFGYRGDLYRVDNDFHVVHTVDGYGACGSGASLAQGSLHTTALLTQQDVHITPRERLTMALDAASYFNAYVAPPYSFVTLEPPKKQPVRGKR